MRKTIMMLLISTVFIILGACGDLDQDEVMEEVKDHTDDVESYHTLWDFQVELHEGMSVEESTAEMDLDVDEPDNAMKGSITEGDGEDDSTDEYYIADGMTFENEKGWGWDSFRNEEMDIQDVGDDLTIAYSKISTMLDEMEDELDMETDDDYYIFTFNGVSEDVFDAQDDPYSLEVSGIDEDEIIQDLKIKVDKDSFNIEEIENTIEADDNDAELEMSIKHNFSDINDVDSIEVPEEVKEEARKAFK